jgi:hypothetical protein
MPCATRLNAPTWGTRKWCDGSSITRYPTASPPKTLRCVSHRPWRGQPTTPASARVTPIAWLSAGITLSAISSIDRRDKAGSTQSVPQ